MKVHELMSWLSLADVESTVLFLDCYAVASESEEIRTVLRPRTSWVHERGLYSGRPYERHYPALPNTESDRRRTDVRFTSEHVVVLSAGPTNLAFEIKA